MVHDSFGRTDPSSSKPVYYLLAYPQVTNTATYGVPELGGQDLYLSVAHKMEGTYQTINR
jgi:hypothetical protein